ncbi:thermonuclease family protein, partial [Candidatus Kaiserbacteria bacterium]|nr:thermonuclease family protein [Candidatus Kaiserbacteria bacterium]
RLLAYIYVDDVFINETLLKEGLADIMTISPNTKYSGQFTTIRDYAKASKVGIWSWCDNQL